MGQIIITLVDARRTVHNNTQACSNAENIAPILKVSKLLHCTESLKATILKYFVYRLQINITTKS